LKYLRDDKAAEDVVQDVFVKFWVKRNDVDRDKNIKSFLFQSTRNRAIEIIRRNKVESKYLGSLQDIDDWQNEDLEEVSDQYILMEKLNNSMRQLPPKCQEVFRMGKLKGLTYREIANTLNISIKTVENQMGRALRLLRQNLSN